MRLPYSPPLIVPLSSSASSASTAVSAATSSGEADASATPAQGSTGTADHV
jgi:hypothetical protein